MKILISKQIKELDNYTIEHEPISSIDLMERAAKAIVNEIVSRWNKKTPFVVFSGPGNNGGDGLAVARLLSNAGYTVETFLFNPSGQLSSDCFDNKKRLQDLGNAKFHEVTSEFNFPDLQDNIVIIDALFGIGLHRPLEGGFAGLVSHINRSKATIISIDIPSGLMSEGEITNEKHVIINATLTLTLGMPKLSFFFTENERFVGEWKALDIGLHAQGIALLDSGIILTEPYEMHQTLRPRCKFAHKGNMGHALLVSGKYGMCGATILAAKACLRSGAGKLTIHTARLNNDILQIAVPEAIISHDLSELKVTQSVDTSIYNSLAIGPGLGEDEETAEAVFHLINHHSGKMVIDADGLNILSTHKDWLRQLPQDTILTPHPKEFERLAGHCRNSYERFIKARNLSQTLKCYIILKGHYSMIFAPDNRIYINQTGNAGMATAGSGDVLTGILAALLARGYTALEAARLGTYLHGLAGDLATNELGQESLTASDIVTFLPKAFIKIQNNKA